MDNKEIIKKRNHFTYIFEETWKGLIVLIFFFLGNGDIINDVSKLIEEGDTFAGICIILGILALLLFFFGFYLFRWMKTTFTVKDGVLTIERNTINKKREDIAINTISNINLNQNIFEMVCGTYRLQIDTSSRSTANKTDVKIILKKDDAGYVKNLIMSMLNEVNNNDNEAIGDIDIENANKITEIEEENLYDYKYSPQEIIRNCALNTSILLVLVMIGMFTSSVISIVIAIKGSRTGAVTSLASIVIQIVMACSFISALVKGWFNDFDFCAGRRGDKIYVMHGLFNKRRYAVPVSKINAVRMDMTFISRCFGYYSVKVINVGGESEDVDGMKILLCGKYDTLRQRLAVLLPEFEVPEISELNRKPMSMTIVGIIKGLFFTLIAAAATYFIAYDLKDFPLWAIPVTYGVIALLVIFACIMGYYADGSLVTERYVVNSYGYFGKKIDFIPYHKIQTINVVSSPLARLFGARRGVISILASSAGSTRPVAYVKQEHMDKLVENFIAKR